MFKEIIIGMQRYWIKYNFFGGHNMNEVEQKNFLSTIYIYGLIMRQEFGNNIIYHPFQ